MATYVNNLRLKEITTGDEDGTWGTSTNTNLELIADAFSFGTKQMAADADETFTMPDATADATRSLYLKITSAVSLTTTRTVTLAPNTINKVWIIENATTGGQSILIKQGSGATVEVAADATQMLYTDGAGATAAVNVVASAAAGVSYSVQTSNYTTANLEGVLADTSGGSFTVTLPASPAAGDQVVVADAANTFDTNNLTVGRNGSTIGGVADDLLLDIEGASVQLVYTGTTWAVYTQIGGNGGNAVTLDDVQTLTNKTITDIVYSLTGTEFNATNGGIQTKTLAANTTFTDAVTSGDAFILQLEGGASFTVTWPTMTWVTSGGNVAPTLTAKDTLVFWKVSTTLYGAYAGSYV